MSSAAGSRGIAPDGIGDGELASARRQGVRPHSFEVAASRSPTRTANLRVATAAAAGKGIRWRAAACCSIPVRRNTYTCSRTVRVSSSIYPMSQQHWDDVHPTRPCPPVTVKRRKQKKATARQLAVAVVAEPSTGRFSLLVYGTDGRARAWLHSAAEQQATRPKFKIDAPGGGSIHA